MRIIVGADHAGFPLKGTVVEALRSWGYSAGKQPAPMTGP
jgi:ribose 5-phosphate isomerase RpiB